MGMIFGEITWIVSFIAAIYLYTSKRGNLLIILGLIGLGIQSFIYTFTDMGLLNYSIADEFYVIGPYINILSIILLVTGIIALVKNGSLQNNTTKMQSNQGVNLSTLFTPRNETNTFSKAEKLRDEACDRLLASANSANMKVIVQRSQAHSPTVWFRLDYLSPGPTDDLSLTMSVVVDIERFDYHRFEHTFTVTVQVGTKITTLTGVMQLDDAAVKRIQDYLMTPGTKLRLPDRVRKFPWQLWRPKNKIQRLRPDWFVIGFTLLAVLLTIIPFIGVFALIGIMTYLYFRSRQRRTYILTSGKPTTDPRALSWMDSWQASIPGLGASSQVVQQGIIDRLKNSGPEGAKISTEKVGYWGTDSWVEREQTVITHRRAIGFIHVVAYGETLFVAWESHINSASWVEQRLSAGVDRDSGFDVIANRVVAGFHQINEYDVSDSNFLAEWLHEAVKLEIKLRMAEHKIDQEIDFTIQRESRTDVLKSSPDSKQKSKTKASRFKRVA